MAYGVPCVVTSVAAEGIEAKDGSEILIANSPESFAASAVELYQNQTLWTTLATNSVDSVSRSFSMEVAEEKLRGILRHYGVLG
jgi:hypothetical protein